MKSIHRVPLSAFAAAGLLAGAVASALWSAENGDRAGPLFRDLHELTRLEPVRVLPHAQLSLAALQARDALQEGKPWKAWRLIRDHVDADEAAAPSQVLLAARAASGWGGWSHVRRLLADRDWLARAEGGEGLLLLARAEEELGHRAAAIQTYRRYAALRAADGSASARLGRLLRDGDDPRAAAAAFEAAAARTPEVEDWMRALQVEQLARAGDPAAISLSATSSAAGSAPARMRRVRAEAQARAAQGDLMRAARRLEWEERVLLAQAAPAEAAQLQLDRAELLGRMQRGTEARELLRAVAADAAVPAPTRVEAARRLGEQAERTAADELARAAAYEAGGKPGLAARSVRAAMERGGPDDGAAQLRLARLLYAERDFGPARAAFRRAADLLQDPELVADAELHAARSLYRSGNRNRGDALAELRRLAERYPGTPAAGSALFVLGDASPSLKTAISYYRRAAAIPAAPEAREALYRVGARSLKYRDPASAVRAWEEYVGRYPHGEETARVAYEAARLHARAGRDSRARAMYAAATLAEPLSYYSIRAGERVGMDPLARVLAEPHPWVGLASDAGEAATVLKRLDALERAGMREEWTEELRSSERILGDRPAALLALAEGLRDRDRPVEAIRLGRELLARRGGRWDGRLLRVVFPFPYREVLLEEADRAGVDPMLLAGLVRQESSFRADARSRVGATGLGQIMPATGRWLAGGVGIRSFDDSLLEVPEVNLRMAGAYLDDLLDRYDGARDLALAAYNAGPGRADRWRRELRRGDADAFREAIPFDETREYVKIVLRNAAVYQRLYGD